MRQAVSEPRFDVTFVPLNQDVPFTPVRLSAGAEGPIVNRFARVHIDADAHAVDVQPVTFRDNSASCAARGNSSAKCVGIVTPSSSSLPLTAFVGSAAILESMSIARRVDDGASVLRVSSRDPTPYLFGLSVHIGDGIESVMKASDCMVFLNAHISGLQWHTGDIVRAEEATTVPSFVVGSRGGQRFCGGALISSLFVLTAAHCVVDGLVRWVATGAAASSGLEDGKIIPVVKHSLRVHPRFDGRAFTFDAALLELQYASVAAPVRLDSTQDFTRREQAMMYGYGVESPNSHTLSPVVRQVAVPLWSRDGYKRVLPSVSDSVLCAGGKRLRDACTGDSGGPLVLKEGTMSTLVGLVSAGYGCRVDSVPGLYTRVSELREFVDGFSVGSKWQPFGASEAPASSVRPLTTSSNGLPAQSSEAPQRRDGYTPATAKTSTPPAAPAAVKESSTPLLVSELRLDALALRLRDALLAFLAGDADTLPLSSSTVTSEATRRLLIASNDMRLYSSSSTASLMNAILCYNSTALMRRSHQ